MSTNPIPVGTSPLLGPLPSLDETQLKTIVPEVDPWTDDRAAAIAIGDFRKAENYRVMNHDWRWTTADQLFLGWVPRKTWEGTKVPRASVAVHMVLEQIEALMPSIISNLFPDENRLAFDVEPDPTTTVDQARAVRELLQSQLQNLGYGASISLRAMVIAHIKQRLIYGNGVTEFGWSKKTETRMYYERTQVPARSPVTDINGNTIYVPNGQMNPFLQKTMKQQEVSTPCLYDIDIRDFYWDPNCSSGDIQRAGYCAHKSLMTINDILEFKGQEGFNIPDAKMLIDLSYTKSATRSDNTKQSTESFRGMSWQPYIDQSIDPNLRRVEVIRYWQRNRHVWLIKGYSKPVYNQPNKYGVLPFITTGYVDVPGRWAALSLPDICETDQRLCESIINARLDELALLIHPPIIKKRGIALPLSQQRLRPGIIWESDDPKNDYIKMDMGNVTSQAFVEVSAAEQRVQKKTGVTDLAVLGTPASGGNSANRTATGVQAQSGAAGKRIQFQVENTEEQLLVPLLNALHSMNQVFLDPNQMVNVLGPDAQFIQFDPVLILNASVKFNMTASGRMRQRQSLAGGGLSVIMETILNPQILQAAFQQGMLPNFPEITDLLTDTYYLPRKSLFVQGSPQQMQAIQQQQQAEMQVKMQMQGQRLEAQSAHDDKNDDVKLMTALISKLLTPQAAHQLLNELVGTKLDTSTGKEPQQLTDGQ